MADIAVQHVPEQLAPIVLFTYNRLKHTRKTIEALQNNLYAKDSCLYIYSDAPKNEAVEEKVLAVRDFLRNVDGFKEVNIIEREENWGLARNIIDGVTEIVNQHGSVIVLEDDIVTSKFFLKYMNDALKLYKNETKVMEISGFVYPIISKDLPETFFLRIGSCWGWATWHDRWKRFQREPKSLIETYKSRQIFDFNYYGSVNFWQQVVHNHDGRLYTWAVFWFETIFRQNGLVLYPKIAMVRNIGFDATGVHCGATDVLDGELYQNELICFPNSVFELQDGKNAIISFLNRVYCKRRLLLDFCKKYNHIYLYGAGYCGGITKKYLEYHKVIIEAFVISDSQRATSSTQKEHSNLRVYDLSELDLKGCAVILTLEEKYFEEVANNLLIKGVAEDNLFYGGMQLARDINVFFDYYISDDCTYKTT